MPEIPLVSVIVPAFNAGRVLAETLSSVRSQTFRDFEVIINVDDGSTDDTEAVSSLFCDTDRRFILIMSPHTNRSRARNRALEHARGEFVAFLDADDVWFPEKLAAQMALFQEEPRVNFAFTDYFFWDGQREWGPYYQKYKRFPEESPVRQLISANVFGTSTVTARRAAVVKAGGFDPNLEHAEDWDMWLRIAEQGLWARGTRRSLVRYRCWPGNASKQRHKALEGDVLMLEKRLHSTCQPSWRPLYKRSLAHARAELEVFQAGCRMRSLIENGNLSAVPPSVLRLWRCQPRWKWLRWYMRLVWPKFLGGDKTAQYVHQKILNRW